MANDEHLALLRQGVAAWNAWRNQNSEIRPDLSGARFEPALQLGTADLSGANLCQAQLNGVFFGQANLREANLENAGLIEAFLAGADLSYAKLEHASLVSANLNAANLTGAILNRASLQLANLSGANRASPSPWEAIRKRTATHP